MSFVCYFFSFLFKMELWDTGYELLYSPPSSELLEDVTHSEKYKEWLNWDHTMVNKTDVAVPASNSSDSGLSSDFHYEQQLSPCKY